MIYFASIKITINSAYKMVLIFYFIRGGMLQSNLTKTIFNFLLVKKYLLINIFFQPEI